MFSENTWEPESNISKELVAEFLQNEKKRSKRRSSVCMPIAEEAEKSEPVETLTEAVTALSLESETKTSATATPPSTATTTTTTTTTTTPLEDLLQRCGQTAPCTFEEAFGDAAVLKKAFKVCVFK